MHCQKNDFGFEFSPLYLPRRLKAVHHRHINIENRHLRRKLFNRFDGFLPVIRFGDDAQSFIFFDYFAQAFSHNRMVVGNNDRNFVTHILTRILNGNFNFNLRSFADF